MKLKKLWIGLILLIIGFSAIILFIVVNVPIEENEEKEVKAYTYEVFHRCESITDWTPVHCSLALSSTQKVEGKYSIKMTADDNVTSAMGYYKTVDWSEFHDIVFSVYHPGWTNEVGTISLWTDAGNWSLWNFDFAAGWTEIEIDLSSTPDNSVGTLNLSNITQIKITQGNLETPGEDYYFDNFRGRSIEVSDYVEEVRIKGGIFPIKKTASFLTHPDDQKYFKKTHTLEILDNSDKLIFLGFITDKNRGTDGLYRYVLDSHYNEAHVLTYVKDFINNSSAEKIQDMKDNSFNFIT